VAPNSRSDFTKCNSTVEEQSTLAGAWLAGFLNQRFR